MPQKYNEELKVFLLNLVEKPHTLRQLKRDPRSFINNSTLAKTHKQILLGNNLKKIRGLVSRAVANPGFAIHIVTDPTGTPIPADPPGFGPSEAIHIVFGAAQPQVKVALKPNILKPGRTEMSVIHIVTDPNA